MAKKSVRYRKQVELCAGKESLGCAEALQLVKDMAAVTSGRSYKNGRKRKDDAQTVELVMHLGVDPKQADQMLRGSISLPKGTGRTNRVIVFCDEALVEKAMAAGATEAGGVELVDKVAKGWMDFDVAVAHPSMMGKVGKLGRVLGPQGKMPTPKAGTVTPDIETAVREYAAGKLEYRNDAGGNIHLPVGKTDFPTEDLQENVDAVIKQMVKIKPSASKGVYIKKVVVSATRSPGVEVQVGV